jgi:hypothetical protein
MCPILRAADRKFLTSVSPNLRAFLAGHPTSLKVLTNALSEAFSNRTVQLYYYYSDDSDARRAGHFYPDTAGMADVIICIAQDSYVVDEYINVLYETLNSKGEKQFRELADRAKTGVISKDDFAKGIMRVEFDAVLKERDFVLNLGLSKKEIKKSHYFHYFADTPTDFDRYLLYVESLYPTNHSPMEEYEATYDRLRKSQ